MRKNLLAGVAMLGATSAMPVLALAQALAPPQMGILQTPSSGKSANDNNSYQAAPLPGAVATPTPGSMVVRLNGKIWTEYGLGGGSGGTLATGKNSSNAGLGTYLRLYPGFDAQATNGLRYGGQAELRENFVATASNTGNTGASGLTSGQTMYVRRDFVWVSNPVWGLLRFGQTDGVSGIFDNGIISQQNYGQGGWNGDAGIAVTNGGTSPSYPWFAQQGAEYGYNKIVYLSPQFAGFDFGLEYASNNGNLEFGPANPATGSPSLVSSSAPPDGTRFINQYTVGARYQGVIGPVSIYGFADYIGSGTVSYTGTAAAALAAAGAPAGSKYNGKFKNQSVGFGGVELTIGGLAVGGGWQGGAYNDPSTSMGTEPRGGASANAYTVGVLYSIGAFSIGGSWYGFDSQGSVALTGISQRHENGLGLGINYTIAPGLNPYLEALYGTRHQGDFNFVHGTIGPGDNTVFSEAILVGIQVGW